MKHIVARTTNRILVGVPLCRDTDYLDAVERFAQDRGKSIALINLFPPWLFPIVGRLFVFTRNTKHAVTETIRPLIEHRLHQLDKYGHAWVDKPNDLLMWLIEFTKARNRSLDMVPVRILLYNLAATSTTTSSITHALFHLAASPELVAALREEAEEVLKAGWSKESIGNLWRMDSFLRESQRVNGDYGISVSKVTLKPVMLSNGVKLPAGTFIAADALSARHDKDVYEDPEQFDPWRFYNLRQEGHDQQQFANTYLAFGIGKHACPGRFFVATEMKMILAYVVLNYDLKFEHGHTRPESEWLGPAIKPASGAKVLFRGRQHPGI